MTTDLAQLSGGLGQLTDGITSEIFYANLGNGAAYEWVGWISAAPDITFDFGVPVHVDVASLWTDNSGIAGVGLFGVAHVYGSDDGVQFAPIANHTTSAEDLANDTARFIDLTVNADVRYLRLVLDDGAIP